MFLFELYLEVAGVLGGWGWDWGQGIQISGVLVNGEPSSRSLPTWAELGGCCMCDVLQPSVLQLALQREQIKVIYLERQVRKWL